MIDPVEMASHLGAGGQEGGCDASYVRSLSKALNWDAVSDAPRPKGPYAVPPRYAMF